MSEGYRDKVEFLFGVGTDETATSVLDRLATAVESTQQRISQQFAALVASAEQSVVRLASLQGQAAGAFQLQVPTAASQTVPTVQAQSANAIPTVVSAPIPTAASAPTIPVTPMPSAPIISPSQPAAMAARTRDEVPEPTPVVHVSPVVNVANQFPMGIAGQQAPSLSFNVETGGAAGRIQAVQDAARNAASAVDAAMHSVTNSAGGGISSINQAARAAAAATVATAEEAARAVKDAQASAGMYVPVTQPTRAPLMPTATSQPNPVETGFPRGLPTGQSVPVVEAPSVGATAIADAERAQAAIHGAAEAAQAAMSGVRDAASQTASGVNGAAAQSASAVEQAATAAKDRLEELRKQSQASVGTQAAPTVPVVEATAVPRVTESIDSSGIAKVRAEAEAATSAVGGLSEAAQQAAASVTASAGESARGMVTVKQQAEGVGAAIAKSGTPPDLSWLDAMRSRMASAVGEIDGLLGNQQSAGSAAAQAVTETVAAASSSMKTAASEAASATIAAMESSGESGSAAISGVRATAQTVIGVVDQATANAIGQLEQLAEASKRAQVPAVGTASTVTAPTDGGPAIVAPVSTGMTAAAAQVESAKSAFDVYAESAIRAAGSTSAVTVAVGEVGNAASKASGVVSDAMQNLTSQTSSATVSASEAANTAASGAARSVRDMSVGAASAVEQAAKAADAQLGKVEQSARDAATQAQQAVEAAKQAATAISAGASANAAGGGADAGADPNWRPMGRAMDMLNQMQQPSVAISDEEVKSYEELASTISTARAEYHEFTAASDNAAEAARRHSEKLNQAHEKTMTGFASIIRGATVLGALEDDSLRGTIEKIAKVQAGIDMVMGAAQLMRGVGQIWGNYRASVASATEANEAHRAAAQAAQTVHAGEAELLQRLQTHTAKLTAQLGAKSAAAKTAAEAVERLARAQQMVAASQIPSNAAALGSIENAAQAAAARLAQNRAVGAGAAAGQAAAAAQAASAAAPVARQGIRGMAGRAVGAVGRAGAGAARTAVSFAPAMFGEAGMAASGLATAVGPVVTTLGALTAAIGGVAFGVTAAVDSVRQAMTNGFAGGAEYGSFVDRIDTAETNVINWVGKVTGLFDYVGDVATKNAGKLAQIQAVEGEKRRAFQGNEEERIIGERAAAMERSDKILETQIRLRTKTEDDAVSLQVGQREFELQDARRRFTENRMTPESQAGIANLAAQKRLEEEIHDLRWKQVELTDKATEKRLKALQDETKEVEKQLELRQKEAERNDELLLTAKERFAQLSEEDQARAISAKQKMRQHGAETLTDEERKSLRQVGDKDSVAGARKADVAEADQKRFDEFFGSQERDVALKLKHEIQRMEVEVKVHRQLEIKFKEDPESFVEQVVAAIDERVENVHKRQFAALNDQLEQKNRQARESADRAIAEIRAAE